jgi:basic membrane protein A and related proteins
MSVTLVASVGEPKDWTPAGLTWTGIEATAERIGATISLVQPVSNADLMADVDRAAAADGAVVVTVGPAADAAVQAAATAHPKTQFLEMDVAVLATSPPNVHGLVFDEAEAGYLAGFVAASFSGSGKVAMVGDTSADSRSSNYAAGFRNGAAQAAPGVGVAVAYSGSPDLPDRGRTAAAGLVKAGSSIVMAMPSLAGIGALREACIRKAQVVAVETDAWQTLPDIRPCLIVSVIKRYDVAVAAAITAIADSQTVATLTLNDVADGGIALSDFHADLPAGFQGELDALLATLKSEPPRSTPAPPASPSPGVAPKPSSK